MLSLYDSHCRGAILASPIPPNMGGLFGKNRSNLSGRTLAGAFQPDEWAKNRD
jgi:hypothetical protein